MDRYRLKNVIILILLLTNGFLLCSLALRDSAARASRNQATEQLVELFAEDNMTLLPGAISTDTPPSPQTLSRDAEREQEAAAFFLGKSLLREGQGDGIYTTYSSGSGVALFRSNGSFDIAGTLSAGDARELCRDFCKAFSYDEPVFLLDENGTGTAVAVCRHSRVPVFNAAVSFTFDRGTLLTVSGTLLPEDGTAATAGDEPYSAAAALTLFQQFRRQSGTSASSVTDMYLCYELQSTTTAPMSLSPSWCIVTDISKYYVNCITGSVTSG